MVGNCSTFANAFDSAARIFACFGLSFPDLIMERMLNNVIEYKFSYTCCFGVQFEFLSFLFNR